MSNVITAAGRSAFAAAQASATALVIDKMVLAFRENLDPDAVPADDFALAASEVKHTVTGPTAGLIGTDTVVYSAMLDASVGDFAFNLVGLMAGETLVAIGVQQLQHKVATAGFRAGNTIIKNFAIQAVNVSDLTGVTISAATWQQDLSGLYAAKLHTHVAADITDLTAKFKGTAISPIDIPESANLDAYTTPGLYRCVADATAATLTNCPVTNNFGLQVVSWLSGWKQILFQGGSQKVFMRTRNSANVWGAWRVVEFGDYTYSTDHNLNNYTAAGNYYIKSTNAAVGVPYVADGATWDAWLKVRVYSTTEITQEFVLQPWGKVASRGWNSSEGWKPWVLHSAGNAGNAGIPDYSAMISLTSGAAAPADGWIRCYAKETSGDDNAGGVWDARLKINGSEICVFGCANHDGASGGTDNVLLPVKKGDVIEGVTCWGVSLFIGFMPNR